VELVVLAHVEDPLRDDRKAQPFGEPHIERPAPRRRIAECDETRQRAGCWASSILLIPRWHSISAGLDYPGVGPEHSWLHDIGRVEYVSATDQEALAAFQLCTRTEGIIPALEPAHALAHVTKLAPTMEPDKIILMNLCGRGDKDIFAVARHLGVKL